MAVLNFGPGVWVFINTLQISRVVPLISPNLNQNLTNFLYADLAIYGVNLNFGDMIVKTALKSIENKRYQEAKMKEYGMENTSIVWTLPIKLVYFVVPYIFMLLPYLIFKLIYKA
jgi:hypothetical protein